MAFAQNITLAKVVGQYVDYEGNAIPGQITFTLDAVQRNMVADQIIIPSTASAVIDSDGYFQVELPCTDDTDLTPGGFTYAVEEVFSGGKSYNISLATLSSTTRQNLILNPSAETGSIETLYGTNASTLTTPTNLTKFGEYAFLNTGTAAGEIRNYYETAPIVGGQRHVFSYYVNIPSLSSGTRDLRCEYALTSADGTYSAVAEVLGTTYNVGDGWVRVECAFTPASTFTTGGKTLTTTHLVIAPMIDAGQIGDEFYVDGIMLEQLDSGGALAYFDGNTFDGSWAGQWSISNAVANGATVTYTTSTNHRIGVGDTVSISNITPTVFNLSAVEVIDRTPTTITVSSGITGTYTSGGQVDLVQWEGIPNSSASKIDVIGGTYDITEFRSADTVASPKVQLVGSTQWANLEDELDALDEIIDTSNNTLNFLPPTYQHPFPKYLTYGEMTEEHMVEAPRYNLIPNPSFEVDTTGWSGNAATIARITSDAQRDTACLQVTKSGGTGQFNGIFSSYNPPVSVGANYYFSACVRIPSGQPSQNLYLAWRWKDSAGNNISTGSTSASTTYTDADDWVRLSGDCGVAPANSVAIQLLVLDATSQAVGTIYYIDSLLLEASTTLKPYFDGNQDPQTSWTGTANNSISKQEFRYRANLCKNPSFESNITGWTDTAAANVTISYEASDSLFGTGGCMKLLSDNTSSVSGGEFARSATYRLAVTEGDVLTASAYLKQGVGTRNYGIYIEWFETATGTTNISFDLGTDQAPSTTEWTRYVVTATAPAKARFASITIGRRSTGLAGDYCLIDGVMLERNTRLQPYFDGSINDQGKIDTTLNDHNKYVEWIGTAHLSFSKCLNYRYNLVRNGAFETDTLGWTNTSANTPIDQYTLDSYRGDACLRVLAVPSSGTTGNGARLLRTGPPVGEIPVRPGEKLTANAYVKNLVGSRNIAIGLAFVTGSNTAPVSGDFVATSVTNPTTWTKGTVTATVPAGKDYAQLWIYFDGTGPANDAFLIDDVSIEFLDTSLDYFDGDYLASWEGTARQTYSITDVYGALPVFPITISETDINELNDYVNDLATEAQNLRPISPMFLLL